jgi:hypothetical protein
MAGEANGGKRGRGRPGFLRSKKLVSSRNEQLHSGRTRCQFLHFAVPRKGSSSLGFGGSQRYVGNQTARIEATFSEKDRETCAGAGLSKISCKRFRRSRVF